MGNTFFWQWEVDLIKFLQANGNAFWDGFFKIFAAMGGEAFLVLSLATIYWCLNKELGKRFVLNIGMVNCLYPMIKNIFFRNRPYIAHSDIECKDVVDKEYDMYDQSKQGYSFPSGHGSNSMVVYGNGGRYVDNKLVKWCLYLIMLLVGVSRFYLGVHYPTDVIVGWLIGLVTMLLIDYCFLHFKDNYVYIAMLIIGLPGMFYAKSGDYYTGYGILLGAILAIKFEEKYINFKTTNNIMEIIVRALLGVGLFVVVRILLKMPFSTEFVDGNSTGSNLYRAIRYTIIMFVEMGLYPMLFAKISKLFKKKEK